jgi:SNF family Na+-dependent transporter
MAYIPQAVSGAFLNDGGSIDASRVRFESVTSRENLPLLLVYLGLFIGAAAVVVGLGVKRGIERASIILMPVFILVLLILLAFSVAEGAFGNTVAFLTQVRSEDFSFSMLLDALGQSFFATGVGAAVMITYGAYLKTDADLPRSSAIVALADTAVALVAAFVVFSLVFAVGRLSLRLRFQHTTAVVTAVVAAVVVLSKVVIPTIVTAVVAIFDIRRSSRIPSSARGPSPEARRVFIIILPAPIVHPTSCHAWAVFNIEKHIF